MKILVFSDSHGRTDGIRRAIEAHRADTDLIYFLGDGVWDIAEVLADFPSIPAVVLRGNWDSPTAVLACGMETAEGDIRMLDGVRIFALHGHTVGVKFGLEDYLARAAKAGASLALFGHTHQPYNHAEKAAFGPNERILFFNPGSVGKGSPCTYGVIYIVNGQISAAHGEV
ncbi:MAG: metallophosphoesterase family protein [Clostridia bacterium]|nr:metallophosphoesterase family protein [Clostridia bacterium]